MFASSLGVVLDLVAADRDEVFCQMGGRADLTRGADQMLNASPTSARASADRPGSMRLAEPSSRAARGQNSTMPQSDSSAGSQIEPTTSSLAGGGAAVAESNLRLGRHGGRRITSRRARPSRRVARLVLVASGAAHFCAAFAPDFSLAGRASAHESSRAGDRWLASSAASAGVGLDFSLRAESLSSIGKWPCAMPGPTNFSQGRARNTSARWFIVNCASPRRAGRSCRRCRPRSAPTRLGRSADAGASICKRVWSHCACCRDRLHWQMRSTGSATRRARRRAPSRRASSRRRWSLRLRSEGGERSGETPSVTAARPRSSEAHPRERGRARMSRMLPCRRTWGLSPEAV